MHGWRVVGLTIALAAGSACGNPCRELSLKPCDCKATPALRQACKARVNARAAQAHDADDAAAQQACSALLTPCTCEALAAGDLKACGLSTENLAAP